jgi:hypothetical protein
MDNAFRFLEGSHLFIYILTSVVDFQFLNLGRELCFHQIIERLEYRFYI